MRILRFFAAKKILHPFHAHLQGFTIEVSIGAGGEMMTFLRKFMCLVPDTAFFLTGKVFCAVRGDCVLPFDFKQHLRV